MKIGEALRHARQSAGFTQTHVAGLLGVSPQYLNDVEHDRRPLSEKHLPALPGSVRAAVAAAMVSEHQAAIERLTNESSAAA